MLKLGTTNLKIPFNKAYLGSALIYKKGPTYIDTEFTACPFPTEWAKVTSNIAYTSTNNHGTWNIYASGVNSSSNKCSRAFDGSNSTDWVSDSMSDNETYETLEIMSPVLIKPSTILLHHEDLGNTTNLSRIEGYNADTQTWEPLATITRKSSATTETFNLSTDNYYSKFRILCYRYSSSFRYAHVYEFQITAGIIRTEV